MAVQSIPAQLTAIFLILQLLQLTVNSQDHSSCFAKEGITEEEKLAFRKVEDWKVLESNPKVKCYLACYLETYNFMDGCTMKYDEAKQKAIKEGNMNLTKALDTCKDKINGKERCECGFQAYKCIDDFMKKLKN